MERLCLRPRPHTPGRRMPALPTRPARRKGQRGAPPGPGAQGTRVPRMWKSQEQGSGSVGVRGGAAEVSSQRGVTAELRLKGRLMFVQTEQEAEGGITRGHLQQGDLHPSGATKPFENLTPRKMSPEWCPQLCAAGGDWYPASLSGSCGRSAPGTARAWHTQLAKDTLAEGKASTPTAASEQQPRGKAMPSPRSPQAVTATV